MPKQDTLCRLPCAPGLNLRPTGPGYGPTRHHGACPMTVCPMTVCELNCLLTGVLIGLFCAAFVSLHPHGWVWERVAVAVCLLRVSTLQPQVDVLFAASVSGPCACVVRFLYPACCDVVYMSPPSACKEDTPLVLFPPDLFAKGA